MKHQRKARKTEEQKTETKRLKSARHYAKIKAQPFDCWYREIWGPSWGCDKTCISIHSFRRHLLVCKKKFTRELAVKADVLDLWNKYTDQIRGSIEQANAESPAYAKLHPSRKVGRKRLNSHVCSQCDESFNTAKQRANHARKHERAAAKEERKKLKE